MVDGKREARGPHFGASNKDKVVEVGVGGLPQGMQVTQRGERFRHAAQLDKHLDERHKDGAVAWHSLPAHLPVHVHRQIRFSALHRRMQQRTVRLFWHIDQPSVTLQSLSGDKLATESRDALAMSFTESKGEA